MPVCTWRCVSASLRARRPSSPGVRVISVPNTVGRPTARAASAKRTKKGDLSALEKKHFPQPQLQHEPGRLNLATLMKRQGYATACVGKWHQGMSTKAEADGTLKMTPLDFGFDYYFGFDAPEQAPYAFIENAGMTLTASPTA